MTLTLDQKRSIGSVLKKVLFLNQPVADDELRAVKASLDNADAKDWNALWHTFVVKPCDRLWQHGVTMYEHINQFKADCVRQNKDMEFRLFDPTQGVQNVMLMSYLAEMTKGRPFWERWTHESQRAYQNATRYSSFAASTALSARDNTWALLTSPYTLTVGFAKQRWTDLQSGILNWKSAPTSDYQRWMVSTSMSYAATKALDHYVPMPSQLEAVTLVCGSVMISRALSKLTDAVTSGVQVLQADQINRQANKEAVRLGIS